MNGILWKWTNYYNGWQPRWFVLKDGILSYFRSEEEVNSGSKGSINLSVCDLNVNIYDSSRFEIIIPGEQKYFLKASNTQERQRWIVALGTGKACHTEPEFQLKERVADYCLPLKEINFKESELRVYLELMNQQVCSIKSQLSENTSPDITAINELTSTLNAACDTFLESLKDLVSIAATSAINSSVPDSPPTHIGSPVFSSLPIQSSTRRNRHTSGNTRHSVDSIQTIDLYTSKSPHLGSFSVEQSDIIKSRRKTNFLIEMPHSFVDWSHQISSSNTISTMDYLNSISSIIHFLDFFEVQPIVSLRADILANVKKLSLKYGSDEKEYCDISKLIVVEDAQANGPSFVLRSLHRTMVFVEHLLTSLLDWLTESIGVRGGLDDRSRDKGVLKELLTDTFNRTLKDNLNWLERGQFTIISQALPPLDTVLCHLLLCAPGSVTGTHRPPPVDQLLVDLAHYCHSIGIVNEHVSHLFTVADIGL